MADHKIQFYWGSGSPFSRKVFIALEEKKDSL